MDLELNVSDTFGEIVEFAQRFSNAVVQTLRNPQADPRQTLIVGGLLIIFLIVAALTVLSLSASVARRRKKREAFSLTGEVPRVAARAPRSRQQIIAGWVITGFIVLVFLSAGAIYVQRPAFCSNCHEETGEYGSWRQSPHRQVSCLACHQQPGLSGWITQKFDYVGWVTSYATNTYEKPVLAAIPNPACKKCHKNILSGTVTLHGIKVRHRDFLQAGSRCTECHNTVGHEAGVPVRRYPTMDRCISCHDTKTASAECKICHDTTTPKAWRAEKSRFVRIDVSPLGSCRGCHKSSTWQQCTACHGLEMPHPEGWRDNHQRPGFVSKVVCRKCHSFPADNVPPGPHGGNVGTGSFCNVCHSFPSPHGSVERWKKMHGPIALGKTRSLDEPTCSECHGEGFIQQCGYCHGQKVCDRCHQPGKYMLPKD